MEIGCGHDRRQRYAGAHGKCQKVLCRFKNVFPFVGAGIGFTSVDFTGPGGSASGSDLAVQAMAGIEFRADKMGFYTEAKYLTSKPEDDFGAEINVTGVGLFAGLSITF